MPDALPLPTYSDTSSAWLHYEQVAGDWRAFLAAIDELHHRFPDRQFAWRGSHDAHWGLNSSLFRRVWWTKIAKGHHTPPDESEIAAEEAKILLEARRWGLHIGARGRLSGLELLATLQHYGVPTRLIDITFNPLVAAFFAVEPVFRDAALTSDDADGRLFVVDVTGLMINESDLAPALESQPEPPWGLIGDWTTRVRAWRPAGFDRRIAAQYGGFLVGGVAGPMSRLKAWPKDPRRPGDRWRLAERLAATSVAIRAHKLGADNGVRPTKGKALFTLRIPKAAKASIRDILKKQFGLDHSTLYADAPGLATNGITWLRSSPPKSPSQTTTPSSTLGPAVPP